MSKTQLLICTCLMLPLLSAVAPAAPAPPGQTVSADEVARLAAPEPGATPLDYRARPVTLRLFGTQGEGAAASATFADTASWATRTYRVGETLGRSLKLLLVHADLVELVDSASGARLSVRAGADLRFRLIEHAFDRAALDHGQHQWHVQTAVMARILARYGVGGSGTAMALHGVAMVQLSAVQPPGVLARLGFQDGDLLVAVNGEAATVASPVALAAAVTKPEHQVLQVTLVRGGARLEVAYVLD